MVAAPPTTDAAFGPGRGLRQAERQQRRGRKQQMAQAWMHCDVCYSREVRMKKNRVFLRGPVCSSSGTAPVPSRP